MSTYNTDLQTNNTSLEEILTTINNLPEAGVESEIETCTVTLINNIEGNLFSSVGLYITTKNLSSIIDSNTALDYYDATDSPLTLSVSKGEMIAVDATYGEFDSEVCAALTINGDCYLFMIGDFVDITGSNQSNNLKVYAILGDCTITATT